MHESILRSENKVRKSLAFWRGQWLALLFHALWLPVALIFFWQRPSVVGALGWSIGSFAYAGWVWVRGWRPWQMPLYQLSTGHTDRAEEPSEVENTVADFLDSKPIKLPAVAIVASGALTPWLVLLIRLVSGAAPFIVRAVENTPLWVYVGLGVLDGVRTGTLAMRFMIRETENNWELLRTKWASQS